MVFWVKKLIFELKMTLMFMYCTVLYSTVPKCTVKYFFFQKTVHYRHVICRFHGFWGQGTHFLNQNNPYVYVMYSTVQYHTRMYSKISFSKNRSLQACYISFPRFFRSRNSFLNSK